MNNDFQQPYRRFRFHLQLSHKQFLSYYQGAARTVEVRTDCRQLIRFPASRLRNLVGHAGIKGHFELVTDAANRFVSLSRIND